MKPETRNSLGIKSLVFAEGDKTLSVSSCVATKALSGCLLSVRSAARGALRAEALRMTVLSSSALARSSASEFMGRSVCGAYLPKEEDKPLVDGYLCATKAELRELADHCNAAFNEHIRTGSEMTWVTTD